MNYQDILYEKLGSVARISHNRPEQRNAETPQLLHELDNAISAAESDPEVKVIILAAVGKHFSSGHDLKEAQANRKNFTVEQRWQLESEIYLDYCMRIWDCRKPVIAQVQGACIAGGFMVANMADIVIASEDAYFSDPVLQSLGAASVEVLIHPYVLGLRKAKEFLFTGGKLSAQEAKDAGMVNRVVPLDQLEEATLELAQRISNVPAFTLELTKRSLNRAADAGGFRQTLNAHFDTHQLSHVSGAADKIRQSGFTKSLDTAKSAAEGGPIAGSKE